MTFSHQTAWLLSHPAVMPTHSASSSLSLALTHMLYRHRWAGLLRMWWQTARGLLRGQVSAAGSEENKCVGRIREKERVSSDNKQKSLKGSVQVADNSRVKPCFSTIGPLVHSPQAHFDDYLCLKMQKYDSACNCFVFFVCVCVCSNQDRLRWIHHSSNCGLSHTTAWEV